MVLKLRALWLFVRVHRLLHSGKNLSEVAALILGPVYPERSDPQGDRRVARVLWGLSASRWLPIRRPCLYRALALGRMLRQRGVDARLNVCLTDLDQPRAAGHAWFSVAGRPVL